MISTADETLSISLIKMELIDWSSIPEAVPLG
jgi:hypothetical protein